MVSSDVWASSLPFSIHTQGQVMPSGKPSDLVFDPVSLNLGDVLEGETVSASVLIRNNGHQTHQIVDITSSCGCTTAEPDTRMLAAGGFTVLRMHMDSFAKRGDVKKSIVLTDEEGNQNTLWVHVHIRENPHAMQEQRSIFDGDCGSCHFDPAQGKQDGAAIYAAVCVMCHGKRGQGAYAPKLVGHKDSSILEQLIARGTGSHHMPAFSQQQGGPLTTRQINALSRWIISLDDK